jgi:hypothetical protein
MTDPKLPADEDPAVTASDAVDAYEEHLDYLIESEVEPPRRPLWTGRASCVGRPRR